MNQDHQLIRQDLREDHIYSGIKKGKLDLLVLRYMVRRLHLTLRQLEQSTSLSQPLLYLLQERHGRTHRIAIYKYKELLLNETLHFVGFISGKQKDLHPSIIREIQRIDKKLLTELVDTPGILSYSSLELYQGNWCNLVLLSEAGAKAHITSTKTHTYAAYHLAQRYYAWIRLHNGIMPEGLDHAEMILQKTTHYSFHMVQRRPSIRELAYGIAH